MKTRHTPLRTCVVCRETSDKKTLLRVVRRPEKDGGGVAADPTGRANGRGAYVCASAVCIDKAVKQKRFERSLSAQVPPALADDLKRGLPAAPEPTPIGLTTVGPTEPEPMTTPPTSAATTGATAP